MRTRSWALLLGAVFLLLAGLTALQYLGAAPAAAAEVWADGALVRTLELSADGEYRIESEEGWNVLTVLPRRRLRPLRLPQRRPAHRLPAQPGEHPLHPGGGAGRGGAIIMKL